jgi:8-oxo-dGTP pyrophosphatase MutT (NUDIX family)
VAEDTPPAAAWECSLSEPRKAATVLLLRDAPAGLEVFMVQRSRRSGFLPNAWVFPGGRVDDGDSVSPDAVAGSLAIPGLDDAEARRHGVAAVRETHEETGVFLGVQGRPDLGRLRAWAWWVTPEAEPKRFDTRFLVARAAGEAATHDGAEAVDSRWVSPREVITQPLSAFPLAPPTWWTLRELSPFQRVDDVWAAVSARSPRPVQPVMEFTDGGMELLLPGHPRHPAGEVVPGFPDHIGWDGVRWVATRGGSAL